jgi:hypothetical protein
MNVIYAEDNGKLCYPSGFQEQNELPNAVWRQLAATRAISIPHHPSHPVFRTRVDRKAVGGWNWDFYDANQVRLVEIYSKHGASEEFGGPFPIPDQAPEGCVLEGLRRGYRLGFTGSSDSHSSRPGSRVVGDLYYPHGGLTAVFAEKLDRKSIHDALSRRHCYATTGARIQLHVTLNGAPMGSEVELESASQPREINIEVAGTDVVELVDVIKNGSVFNRFTAKPGSHSEVDAFSTDHAICAGADFYYVRVTQKDGHMAWASPIFVTYKA